MNTKYTTMEPIVINDEPVDEKQLFQTLKTAIATSKRSLMDDGILLICWGLAFSIGFLWKYYQAEVLVPSRIRDLMMILHPVIGVLLIGFTIYFIFFRKNRVRTYTAISTRFVWIGVIIAHNLNVIITNNFMAEVNFEMLHPLQMVLIGFALFVTGGIYRYYVLTIGGIIMWLAAAIASGYDMHTQYLIRGIADFVCFVIPGILMYMEVKKSHNV